jgi:hypothetical protein
VGVTDPAELRAAVDDIAIRGLIAAYADVVNRRAWDELDELFLPDAPIRLDLRDREPMEHAGPAAIGAFIAGAIERFEFFEFVALNVRVLRDGDPDRAKVRTYMCELRQDHEGVPSRAFGLYQDAVERTGTGWRFARRDYQSIGRGEHGLDLMPPPEIF